MNRPTPGSRLVRPALILAFALAAGLPALAQLPPLLDRELFFGNPEIAGAQISPDGKYVAFLKPWKETRNVWVKKTEEPYGAARLVTADPKRPIPGFFWSRDSKVLLFIQDKDGDENYNVYAVDPAAKPEAGKDAPPARNLTDAKGVRAAIYDVPKKTPDTIYVGLNDRDAAWHDVYKVTVSTGKRELVRKNTDRIAGWFFDRDGQLRLAERTTDTGDTEILKILPEGYKTVYACSVFETCEIVRFHKDGKRVYIETNKGEPDLIRLVLFDPETGKEELVESDPKGRVDFGEAIFSQATDELVATAYEDERTRVYFRDKASEADYRFLEKQFPNTEISLGSVTADDGLWMIAVSSDVDPGTRYLFHRKAKKLDLQYKVRERIPREQMAPMKAVTYKSSDGLEIPAFLTLPKGIPAKNLPAVVFPHGGPWARDGWGFNNYAQFLANRGYAVLAPNFRGSTGYGKKFLNAGNRQWGDRMQDDITSGVKYLVAQGIADPKRVGIMGGSYGGYATLAGVAFTPDVYAAGVDIVGPSNLLTLLETIPPYWEAGRVIFHERMGNPNTPEGKKQLERQSPLFSASKIRTPLLVAQGANDPRVKKAESEQIVIALRDRGFPVEYILAPDEGHGFARPVNNMALFAAAEAFFAKHLGGRFQEGGTPEVVARLKEITVDPKTVVLTKKVDAAAVGAPKPAADLSAGTRSYLGAILAGGQSMPISVSRVTKEDGGTWVVTDTAKLPMGEAVDTVTLEKGTLVSLKRTIRQGPVAIDVAFKDGKATGTMAMGGDPKAFEADLGGPVFADGAGAWEVLARLPLAEGYSATFRNFEVQKQKAALKQIKVLGAEDVTVAAGTFAAWKAEVSSAEGDPGVTTVWIAKDSRKVVKTSATLPQMGGATITSELQP
ncbi:MAG TPA: prolyl oligopeptidase family serine peptidase [Thermoanaerobaculia bacterium]|nr:prolyl oligopeptidase family serine peptidase [Thermoanaerobaculia bacterium]HQR65884.1 prolyl oligopeptidase family serine peptidase [Thermoanaerobaculia bacterium]